MTVGQYMKEEFMILLNMQKYIQVEKRFSWAKVKTAPNYFSNIILGLTAI